MPIEVYVKPQFADLDTTELLTEVILPGSSATYIELSEAKKRSLFIARCRVDNTGADFYYHKDIGDDVIRQSHAWYADDKKIHAIGDREKESEFSFTLRSVAGAILHYTFCYTEKMLQSDEKQKKQE